MAGGVVSEMNGLTWVILVMIFVFIFYFFGGVGIAENFLIAGSAMFLTPVFTVANVLFSAELFWLLPLLIIFGMAYLGFLDKFFNGGLVTLAIVALVIILLASFGL